MAMVHDQTAELERVRNMLEVRMKEKPRRYQHSLGVARTAVDVYKRQARPVSFGLLPLKESRFLWVFPSIRS